MPRSSLLPASSWGLAAPTCTQPAFGLYLQPSSLEPLVGFCFCRQCDRSLYPSLCPRPTFSLFVKLNHQGACALAGSPWCQP